ncbi:Cystathionine beta-lyase family protein involved in aluminum resistance [Evansella caseinilytica]|uniref:Cystathionine beta-lyase family protein involved in aluminum resistance n=1 Tax=Evansella caseinilytica TaxID=1503961 RepID=A0A1H3LX00_9BACI|nr:methionine gamma-lyase family protein [Evansella caseinilytica]SDY68569.1 Cystathionine beta-lyase family protein involved in aluminum resistance [Evansella caseinilytica]
MSHLETSEKIQRLADKVEEELQPAFRQRARISEKNQRKVLQAFRHHEVSDYHFHGSTGYGYDDIGRETLENIYAQVFGGEAAIVRPQMVSGTHAISTALYGLLRPGDELLYITGKPYDTLEEVIGIRGEMSGSLRDYGITYQYVPLKSDAVDFGAVQARIHANTKVIGIQRSKGYDNRPSFTVAEIGEMVKCIKEINPELIVFVDNCYGEFVELTEPCDVGADIVAGSLIKNPGGGIVRTGGYLVGNKLYLDACASRLTAPGIGRKGGATLNSLLEMFQGFFLAPHVVNQAVKGAMFTAKFLEELGMTTSPKWDVLRTDLIQSVSFPSKEMMIAFCQAIQAASPVDAHVKPQPSDMPGYEDQVIMAAGTFIQGASIELTADGPIRPPYTAYVQGGLTYEHVRIGVVDAVCSLAEQGLLQLQ